MLEKLERFKRTEEGTRKEKGPGGKFDNNAIALLHNSTPWLLTNIRGKIGIKLPQLLAVT